MPKVTTSIARKDYPQFGIEKGQEHFVWSFYGTGTFRSLTYPKASQLTQSDALRTLLEVKEEIDSADPESFEVEVLQDWVERLEEGYNLLSDSFESLSEGLQQAPVGQTIESRMNVAEEFKSELEQIIEELSTIQDAEDDDSGELQAEFERLQSRVQEAAMNADFD